MRMGVTRPPQPTRRGTNHDPAPTRSATRDAARRSFPFSSVEEITIADLKFPPH